MTALVIILSIIAALALLLCIKVSIVLDYNTNFSACVRWLFLTFDLYPPRKTKKEKPVKEKNDKQSESKQSKPKEKEKEKKQKSSALGDFYNNQGLQGIIDLASRTLRILGNFFGRVVRGITVEHFKVDIAVCGSDAADTAIKYGRTCAAVFPLADFFCSNMRVKKIDLKVEPDFIDSAQHAIFYLSARARPLRLLAAVVAAALALLFKVLFRLFLGARRKPNDEFNTIHLKGES